MKIMKKLLSIRHSILRNILLLLAFTAVCSNAWGEKYEIIFNRASSDDGSEIKSNTMVSTVVDSGKDYVLGFTDNCAKAYYACRAGVKLGNPSEGGTLEFNITSKYQSNIKKITIKSEPYDDGATLSLSTNSETLKEGIVSGNDYTHSFDNATTVSSIKIATSTKRAYISQIILDTDAEVTPTKLTLTYSVNGNTTVKEAGLYYEGEEVDLEAPTTGIPEGYVFKGWSASVVEKQQSAPTYVGNTMPAESTTYYAVFAVETETPATPISTTITASTSNFPQSYADSYSYILNGISFNIKQAYVNGQKMQWRSSTDSNGAGRMYNNDALNNIQSIILTYNDLDVNNNFTVNVGSTKNPSAGILINGVETPKNVYTYDCSSANADYFVLTNGKGAGYLTSIVINYISGKGKAYSDYCTTVEPPVYTAQTLSMVAYNNDGYWATFSNENVTFFPEKDGDTNYQTVVNTVAVDGTKLAITALTKGTATINDKVVEGYFVPANTGVLIKVVFNKEEKTIPYYTVTNKTVSALENNMLYAGQGTQITEPANCKYYRLTYDNFNAKTGLGFYWGADNGAAFTANKGVAYLAIPIEQVGNVKGFAFDEAETDGICNVDINVMNDNNIYNINGLRISQPVQGQLFIKNGRKYLSK